MKEPVQYRKKQGNTLTASLHRGYLGQQRQALIFIITKTGGALADKHGEYLGEVITVAKTGCLGYFFN